MSSSISQKNIRVPASIKSNTFRSLTISGDACIVHEIHCVTRSIFLYVKISSILFINRIFLYYAPFLENFQ